MKFEIQERKLINKPLIFDIVLDDSIGLVATNAYSERRPDTGVGAVWGMTLVIEKDSGRFSLVGSVLPSTPLMVPYHGRCILN